MLAAPAIAPAVLLRARADQVATLYGQWHRTTLSMAFGAALLCVVLWRQTEPVALALWVAAILVNQGWRGLLASRYRRRAPPPDAAARWGTYWSFGSAMAGTLWGIAAVGMFPASAAHQALLIVCLFGVVLGGLNLTAVYKPAFYGFVLTALVPLIARVAWENDEVHFFTAGVMLVVLAFVLTYGHHLNDLLTQSLAMRYENRDLIDALTEESAAAERARTAAETANRAKSQFLAAASHDLRQPLHAMGLFAAALAGRVHDSGVAPLVQSIHASVEALEGLFSQLLDLSRLDAGALHPEIAPTPLAPVLARLARDLTPQATAAGLVLRVCPSSAVVLTDPVLLERILRNFASNALRYTREGGIVIGARHRGSAVRLDVVDTGIGIAMADQGRIFDEFVQLDGTAGGIRRGHGMGLGLNIVRRLASLLGHRLELASCPGRGSRFSILVPRASTYRVRAPLPLPAATSPVALAQGAAALHGRRVVVIDDDVAVLSAMDALLRGWGATVVTAGDARTALAALGTAGAPDLLVVDLRLRDGASGLEAVALLRRALRVDVPVLVVSGDLSDAASAEVDATGATLLHKPLMAGALLAAAAASLARAPAPVHADKSPAAVTA